MFAIYCVCFGSEGMDMWCGMIFVPSVWATGNSYTLHNSVICVLAYGAFKPHSDNATLKEHPKQHPAAAPPQQHPAPAPRPASQRTHYTPLQFSAISESKNNYSPFCMWWWWYCCSRVFCCCFAVVNVCFAVVSCCSCALHGLPRACRVQRSDFQFPNCFPCGTITKQNENLKKTKHCEKQCLASFWQHMATHQHSSENKLKTKMIQPHCIYINDHSRLKNWAGPRTKNTNHLLWPIFSAPEQSRAETQRAQLREVLRRNFCTQISSMIPPPSTPEKSAGTEGADAFFVGTPYHRNHRHNSC